MTTACFPGHKDWGTGTSYPLAQTLGTTSQETVVRQQQQPDTSRMRHCWKHHKHSNSDTVCSFTEPQQSSLQVLLQTSLLTCTHVSTCCTLQQQVISTITTWYIIKCTTAVFCSCWLHM